VLRYLAGRCKQSGFAFVLKPGAFAIDVDDNRVVQNTIERRRREDAIAGESGIPTAEGKIRSEDHRAAFFCDFMQLSTLPGTMWPPMQN
jgi:hypothetical protein